MIVPEGKVKSCQGEKEEISTKNSAHERSKGTHENGRPRGWGGESSDGGTREASLRGTKVLLRMRKT